MKRICLFSITLFCILLLCACSNTQNNSSSSYNSDVANNTNTNLENSTPPPAPAKNTTPSTESQPVETVAAEFSTQIKTKSPNRADNIRITCSKINEELVKPGEEFSFCGRTGVSKESEGYKKADVIVGEKTIKALGGGNCQVSSTLYNAVLKVPDLQVTERHPHGKDVNYVPEGKDAAIAHGSKDLKFVNKSDKDLKIYSSTDGKSVSVKLVFVKNQ